MDCDLRVIKGPDAGVVCRLQPGTNLVGRSPKAALKLTPADISWEHVAVTRNGDNYTAENLSSLGTWLDDARLSGPVKLRPRDQLRLSQDTVIRLEGAGGADSGWLTDRKLMVALVILIMILGGVAAMVLNKDESKGDNWNSAYSKISAWTIAKTDQGLLPPSAPARFANAWRQDQVEDYVESRQSWLDLHVFLNENASQFPLLQNPPSHPNALDYLLNPPKNAVEFDDQQMLAAWRQFITRRLTYATKLTQNKRTFQ